MAGGRRGDSTEAMKKQGKKPKGKRARRYAKGLGRLQNKVNKKRIQ